MEHQKADLVKRFLAALIDGAIAWVFALIPVIGGLIGLAYLLLKDAVMYQVTKDAQWMNKSVGKKLMQIKVVTEDETVVDWATSAKRNIPISIGNIFSIIPVLGWIIGFPISVIVGIIELVLILTDPNARRLGDRWAGTQVVPDDETASQQMP